MRKLIIFLIIFTALISSTGFSCSRPSFLEKIFPSKEDDLESMLSIGAKTDEDWEILGTAKRFAEDYGTFSSAGDYQNVVLLYSLMTESFRKDRENFVNRGLAGQDPKTSLSGSETKVEIYKLLEKEDEKAKVLLSCSCREISTKKTRSFYRNALVLMEKKKGEWKVAGFEWQ